MTTIAATRDAIAGDRMVSIENKSTWYPTPKVRRIKGALIGAAGDGGDCVRFLDWAETGFAPSKRPKFVTRSDDEDCATLLMLTAEGIYFMMQDDPCPERVSSDFYAIGSGGKAALGALHAGATLERAMEIAFQIDPYTRPPFDILKLDAGE